MNDNPQSTEEWFRIIAHDLKTPIGAVRGALEVIEQAGPLNEMQQRFADRAKSGLERMLGLVESMLDMSWIDGEMKLRLEDCDLADVIYQTAALLESAAAEKHVTVQVDIPDDLPAIVADGARVGQVVENLLGNAIKYNQEGGGVWLTAINTASRIEVRVRDNGMGIPPDELPKIFDLFYRGKQSAGKLDGSGLGLPISKAIILRHGGSIHVESLPETGTVFIFTLPHRADSGKKDANIRATGLSQVVTSGEGADMARERITENPSEISDSVDDNLQEGLDVVDVDSKTDDQSTSHPSPIS